MVSSRSGPVRCWSSDFWKVPTFSMGFQWFSGETDRRRYAPNNDGKSQNRSGVGLVYFSYTLQLALNQKLGRNSQIWDSHFSNNFFLRSGSLTRGGCPDHWKFSWLSMFFRKYHHSLWRCQWFFLYFPKQIVIDMLQIKFENHIIDQESCWLIFHTHFNLLYTKN